MNARFTESVVEDAALAWLKALGYSVLHGPDIAAGEPGAERGDPDNRDVLLDRRLRQAPYETLCRCVKTLTLIRKCREFATWPTRRTGPER
jgi:hypothetical protein